MRPAVWGKPFSAGHPSNPATSRRLPRPYVEPLEPRFQLTTLPTGFSETLVASNLGLPTAMDVLPDGRILVASQEGNLRVVKGGTALPTPFVHLSVDSSGERGLIGVAHDPNFAANHFVYLYYTVPAADGAAAFNQISRFTADGDVAAAGSEVDILKLNNLSGATNHNGGAIHFGADNLLYVGVGENANSANAQTLSNLLGKVLRLDVSQIQSGDPINDVAKLVPPDNPFVGTASGINQAIYALGLRNPFTFAVQPGSGTIYVNDVGQNTWEEIDLLVAGGNYGWGRSEGFANPPPPIGLGPGTYQDPILAYNHTGGPAGGGIAIVGGAFYNPGLGASDPFPTSYTGKYFYGDLGGNWIRLFDPVSPGSLANPDTSAAFATDTVANPVAMTLAPDGGLYYLARGSGGKLLKISFANPQTPLTMSSIVVGAGAGGAPGSSQVRVFAPGGTIPERDFVAYDGFAGGVRVATGDVNGDGVPDLITGSGPGASHVKVFDGLDNHLLRSFLAFPGATDPADPNYFARSFQGGVYVASGDVDEDGKADLLVGADSGAGPNVRVFSGADASILASFWAFDPAFRGGVRVATADVDLDGRADVIVGAGPGAGPHVKVFSLGPGGSGMFGTATEIRSFFAFDPGFSGGIFAAGGRLTPSGGVDIVASADAGDAGAPPHVMAFDLSGSGAVPIMSFEAFAGFGGGVRVGLADLNGDGLDEILAGSGFGAAHVKAFAATDALNPALLESFLAFDPLPGGIYLAI